MATGILQVWQGDITVFAADALVNAANSGLVGGGGVDGAIHHKGGPSIMEELKKIREKQGGCPIGQAVITGGGNLPARYVIHTVGPIYHGRDEEAQQLAACYRNSMELAYAYGVKTIAFSAISTGVYGYPLREAARIAIETVREWLVQKPEKGKQFTQVTFVVFHREAYDVYGELLTHRKLLGENW